MAVNIKVVSSNRVNKKFPPLAFPLDTTPYKRTSKRKNRDSMDSDSDVGGSINQTEPCSSFLSNGIKRQMSNSSDTSDADGCQSKTRRPKLRRRPTRQIRLPSCKHRYEEDTSDDDGFFDSKRTVSACKKIASVTKDGFTSSNESESDRRSRSSQDSENEQLSIFSVDSDCGDHTEINAAVVNEEAEDAAHIYLESISSSSNVEELGSCDDSSGDYSSSDEKDEHSFLSDDESDHANVFTKSIYEGSNLSVGASCILITQFSRKYKLPRKAQNDLLTLIKLHCPEGVEIALPQTYKEMLKKTMPSIANITKVRVCSICTKKIEGDATVCEDGHPVGRPTKEDSYFIELPLEPQLKMVIEGSILIIIY